MEEPPDVPAPACLNCGEKLLGEYCWRCGQAVADLHRPLRELAGNFFEDVLNLDTRLLRSVRPLLLRPGLLTRDYLAGRRAPYATPLRLFLIATLLFAGLSLVLPTYSRPRIITDPQQAAAAAARREGTLRIIVLPQSMLRWGGPAISQRVMAGAEKAKRHPEELVQAMVANLPRLFFLLLPVFALLVKLFYWRQDRFYLDHLIFSLHFHAFGFVVLSLNALAVRLWPPLLLALWSWFVLYLAMALRRVYGGSRGWTAVKLGGLLCLYVTVFFFGILGMIPVTLYLF